MYTFRKDNRIEVFVFIFAVDNNIVNLFFNILCSYVNALLSSSSIICKSPHVIFFYRQEEKETFRTITYIIVRVILYNFFL